MKNSDIAKVFSDIADLLEIKGENQFKIRAYQRATRAIEHLPVEIEQMVKEGADLQDIPGVGEAIAKKTMELVTTGRLGYYDELRAEFPEGISTLLDIPGVGPKIAIRLCNELGVNSIDDLESAILDGRVASLPRLGDKVAENILRQLQAMRTKERRIPIGEALPVVEEIMAELGECPGLRNLTPAGSLRRFRETVGDIDLMGTADDREGTLDAFVGLPRVKEVLVKGGTKASVLVHGDLQIDLRLVDHDCFGSLLQYFTGSKQHNIALRERGHRKGLKLSEYGITDLKSEVTEKFTDEEAFYQRLGLQFIPPELREGQWEVERAEQKAIPRLIELGDLKGDLHVHSDWSDGHDSIESMALAARARGYQYIAITDHSMGRGVARGLNEERLRRQIAEISSLNEQMDGFRILTGIEVDIRADGTLDLPEDMLSELDIVIAAVHSAMNQEQGKMTERILRAIKSPHVDVLAHPTCRLLGEREPIMVDLEAVFRAAADTNTALEINAMPSRLDLKDMHAFRARELGLKLIITTDAHSASHLDLIRFGVGVARRGWCEAKHILNTRPLKEVAAFLNRERGWHGEPATALR
ncbi:DNA polymerase/3'-5' exonuclease PolX [subsurface metagenome]